MPNVKNKDLATVLWLYIRKELLCVFTVLGERRGYGPSSVVVFCRERLNTHE